MWIYNNIITNIGRNMRMKKSLRKLVTIALCSVFLIGTTTGCGFSSTVSADRTMDAFYQLFIYRNIDALEGIGIDAVDAHKAQLAYEDTTIETLKTTFRESGTSISNNQAKKIYSAIGKAFANLKYEVKITDDGSKNATVTVSSQYINYSKIFKDAKTKTIQELKSTHIEEMEKAKDQLVANVVKGFEDATPSTDIHEKTFELKKKKIKSGDNKLTMFYPKDLEQAGSDLLALVTNQ